VAEPINPGEYDDPTCPPPGYMAIECPDCSLSYLKSAQSTKMSVGPLPSIGLGAERGATLCMRCRGRTWVWWRLTSVPQSGSGEWRDDR
jgi:hypothetical protein